MIGSFAQGHGMLRYPVLTSLAGRYSSPWWTLADLLRPEVFRQHSDGLLFTRLAYDGRVVERFVARIEGLIPGPGHRVVIRVPRRLVRRRPVG
jgi:hypothetical protein